MALSGIQIYKYLPKTNCKDCGFPTCLAFAMNLAAGKVDVSACIHLTEQIKTELEVATAPPIRTVVLGNKDNQVSVGGETVLFRHEKTFFNKTGVAVLIADNEPDEAIDGKIERFNHLRYERAGQELRAELVAVQSKTGDPSKYKSLVNKVTTKTDAALILMGSIDMISPIAMGFQNSKALLCSAHADNFDEMVNLAKESGHALAIKGKSPDELNLLAEKAASAGIKDIILDPSSGDISKALEDQITIRRLALAHKAKGLGYPTIVFPYEMANDLMEETILAATIIPKYAGLLVLSDLQGHSLFPLLLQRMNIFTDPQRPMRTDEGVYPFNNPGPESPLLVTTNFSLTYFIVSAEIENSKMPAYLAVVDTEGLSVLTSWAAGKFDGEIVGSMIKKLKIEDQLHKKVIVVPGLVAVIRGELEEELGNQWIVKVGPKEAIHIPAFLKSL